jgi:hypothetical protein
MVVCVCFDDSWIFCRRSEKHNFSSKFPLPDSELRHFESGKIILIFYENGNFV